MLLQLFVNRVKSDAFIVGLDVSLGVLQPLGNHSPGGAVCSTFLLGCVQVVAFGLDLVL